MVKFKNEQYDPENPPLTDKDFERLQPVPYPKYVRQKMGLSAQGFSNYTGLSLDVIRNWDTGKDLTWSEEKYLKIIETLGTPPEIKRVYNLKDVTPSVGHLLEIIRDFKAHTGLKPIRVHLNLMYWLQIDLDGLDPFCVKHTNSDMIYNTGPLGVFFGTPLYWQLANDIRIFANMNRGE